MKNFTNKVILITGASRGLGRALSIFFAKEGANLILLSKRTQGLEAIADELDQYDCSVTLVPVDLAKPENLVTLPTAIMEKFGKLDILIGNAGLLNTLMPLTHYAPRDIEKIFNVNVMANWHLLAGLEHVLSRSEYPRAIFVTSGAAHASMPYWGPYAASKAALEEMVKTYAKEKAKTNFRINLVDPGIMQTDMFKIAMPGAILSDVPMPEDKLDAFHYLASNQCQETGGVFKADDFPL